MRNKPYLESLFIIRYVFFLITIILCWKTGSAIFYLFEKLNISLPNQFKDICVVLLSTSNVNLNLLSTYLVINKCAMHEKKQI
jgi:hypothetical protein